MQLDEVIKLDQELKKYLEKYKPRVIVTPSRVVVSVNDQINIRPISFGSISTSVFGLTTY